MIKKTKEVEKMKLVINIPKEMYERIKDGYVPLGISKYLKNGTPLPKEHGRLIDADKLIDSILADRQSFYTQSEIFSAINGAPTIIKADGGNEDEVNNWICQML